MHTINRGRSLIAVVFLAIAAQAVAQPSLDAIAGHFPFREIGPTRQGGRVVAFGVTQGDPYRFFVGAGPGGLWRTINNGTSFEPVFDREGAASIGDVAVAPSRPEVVWVGTGEANLRNSTYYGNGVYRSTDGGETWTHRGLEETHHIGRVRIHPRDPDIVYVAAQGHLYSENEERGVYKTVDGGETWELSLKVVVDGRSIGATEIVMDPADPDTLYAVTYDRQRFAWSFRIAGPGSGIYKSTDAGASWRKLEKGLPSAPLGKIGLGLFLRNPAILYAVIDDQSSPGVAEADRLRELFSGKRPSRPPVGQVVYRSEDAGESWKQVSPEGESIGERSNYYGQIIVDPNDADHVYVLGMRVWESVDGGNSWAHNIRYGGDNHVLWIDPDDSRHILMGYDYGMAITYDGGARWYHPDELGMAQIYTVGVDMDYPYNVYCGRQDFGSWKGPSTKKGRFPIRFEDWEHVNGGDGFYNRVDPNDSRWLYSGSQFGHITRIDQKTGQRRTIVDDESEEYRFHWSTPLLVSSHDSDVLYVGANKLLRSEFHGEAWAAVSPDLTRADAEKFEGVGAVRYGAITTIDESPLDSGVLWVGTDDGNVQLTRDGGKTWTLLNDRIPDNPGYWVTRVEASHHDAGTAYVSMTGFHVDDFRPFVYKTEDFGASWRSIATGLRESINVIQEDRVNVDLLFVGTDLGVYVSLDGGARWTPMRNGVPTIAVHDLVIHPRENDLVVGTHGRGVFIADISPLQELTEDVLGKSVHLFSVEPKVQWVMPEQPAVSAQNFEGENEPYGAVVHYYLKDAPQEEVRLEIFDRARLIHEIPVEASPGLQRADWGMVRRRARSDEEKTAWDKRQEYLSADVEFFDYYDTVEVHGSPEDEVDRWGRSLETRVHQNPGVTDRDWAYYRVTPGTYRVALVVGGETVATQPIVISKDHWYDR